MRRHKIPVHLEQPDFLLFGLNARQCSLMMAGLGSAFSLWNILIGMLPDWWGLLIATLAALMLVLACLVMAFVQVAGRGLELWAVVALAYLGVPKLYLCSSPPQTSRHRALQPVHEQEEEETERQSQDEMEDVW